MVYNKNDVQFFIYHMSWQIKLFSVKNNNVFCEYRNQ